MKYDPQLSLPGAIALQQRKADRRGARRPWLIAIASAFLVAFLTVAVRTYFKFVQTTPPSPEESAQER